MADNNDGEFIELRAVDRENNAVHLKVKKTVEIKRIKGGYAKRKGLRADQVRFTFDGVILKDTDTPVGLGLEDGDEIQVHDEMTGGYNGTGYASWIGVYSAH